jgi:DNA-binding NarL/FixJ family response regulator
MALRCRGKTPLTYSVLQGQEDLKKATSKIRRVVLLTDGLESDRRAKPLDAARQLSAAGIRLDVVCLAMESTDALAEMAAAGGGRCYLANDVSGLQNALQNALGGEVKFRVLTPEGKEVAAGRADEVVALPAGPYVVELELPDGRERVDAWVHQDGLTTLRLK